MCIQLRLYRASKLKINKLKRRAVFVLSSPQDSRFVVFCHFIIIMSCSIGLIAEKLKVFLTESIVRSRYLLGLHELS